MKLKQKTYNSALIIIFSVFTGETKNGKYKLYIYNDSLEKATIIKNNGRIRIYFQTSKGFIVTGL